MSTTWIYPEPNEVVSLRVIILMQVNCYKKNGWNKGTSHPGCGYTAMDICLADCLDLTLHTLPPSSSFFNLKKLILEREEGRQTHWFVVPLIYAFIGWFLHVPWPKIKSAMLVYWDNFLSNWATWPRPLAIFFEKYLYLPPCPHIHGYSSRTLGGLIHISCSHPPGPNHWIRITWPWTWH